MKRSLLLLILLLLVPVASASAQTPKAAEDEVMGTVRRLFDGMRAGDTMVVRSVFHPTARLLTTGARNDTAFVQEAPINRFIAGIGTPHDQVYDERIWNPEVRIDGNLATAWMNYAFFLGDTFSHCGVNSFQLFRESNEWKIIQIADTRRREGCEMPPER